MGADEAATMPTNEPTLEVAMPPGGTIPSASSLLATLPTRRRWSDHDAPGRRVVEVLWVLERQLHAARAGPKHRSRRADRGRKLRQLPRRTVARLGLIDAGLIAQFLSPSWRTDG